MILHAEKVAGTFDVMTENNLILNKFVDKEKQLKWTVLEICNCIHAAGTQLKMLFLSNLRRHFLVTPRDISLWSL